METQLCIVVCVLVSAGLVAGQVYHFPTVSLDTPDNSVCPPDSQLEDVRTDIFNRVSGILFQRVANKTTTIPACGGSGWRQVAFLDMTDPNQTCPQPWRLYSQDSVRACGRQQSNTATCDSVQFSPDGYEYTQVCGRITGYQYATPDGYTGPNHVFDPPDGILDLDDPYLDGISITHGTPRHHIWSLYGGVREFGAGCCGDIGSLSDHPSSVGANYFCDTGNPTNSDIFFRLFTEHPLWDGIANCASNDTCCAPHSGPWFKTNLTAPSTDNIELRICGDEPTSNEDTPLELIKIYIK